MLEWKNDRKATLIVLYIEDKLTILVFKWHKYTIKLKIIF